MKKAVIGIILYVLTLYVIIPGIFYLYKGEVVPIYSSFLDMPSFIKAAAIILSSLLLSVLVLCVLPQGKQIAPTINTKAITKLFYFSILFKLFFFYVYGGFSGLLGGEGSGKLSTYISIFLNPYILLLVIFFGQKKKSDLLKPILFYIISVTLSGSRSGVLSVFLVFFIGYAFETFTFYKKKILKFLKYALIFAPVLYVLATQVRSGASTVDYSFLQYAIAGRLSTMETAMYPIYYKDNRLDMTLFNEKYSVENQSKLILDAFLPGQFFEFDISPNNYYRSMFMDASLSFVRENYMSINMTLPVYLYVKYGYIAIFLTVLYMLGFYYLVSFFRNSPLIAIAILSTFFGVVYYFDWLMIFTELYSALLTVLVIKIYLFFYRFVVAYFKNQLTTAQIEAKTSE